MSKKTISIALSVLLSSTMLSANSDNMAESLMKLRGEVEHLDTQINDEKDAYKSSMKSLSIQKSELEAMVSREDLKIKQINKELSDIQAKIVAASKNSQGLKPIVIEAIDNLSAMMKTSIPFKTSERVESVEKIKQQLNDSLITPQKALSQVYNAYNDEIRMTKENGIFKQTIVLNSEEKLAEIARIGTAMMFFKTPNDTVGYVVKDGNSWTYQEELNKEKQTEILSIFDAFKKQIRTGYFTLPNALILSEAK
ncbi:DUF3450 family protein [Sulfurimonas microaerophilic]|uniref:DUF3450 family protein n=1 Tax=Sulfurimonas microaerophilic TaxID=3058392 RepID=UPI00271474B7|nr:DUF3450 family protein [Sulfurimonas sp. hsl 1-7]